MSVFHLSFPVRSLAVTIPFYEAVFGARIGRRNESWVDIVFFGHQITVHEKPLDVLPAELRGVRHFGAILSWQEWEDARSAILAFYPDLEESNFLREVGTEMEHAKLLVEDPDGNLIELKAYKSLATVSDALVL